MFTEHYSALTHSLGVMETRLTCVLRGVNGNRYFSNSSQVLYDIWSSLSSPCPDYWWVSHAESVNLWLMTCTCMPCNQTLFKQSTSETEDSERVETVIIFTNTHPPLHQGSFISRPWVWVCVFLWMGNSGPDKHTKTVTSRTAGTLFPRPEWPGTQCQRDIYSPSE